MNEDSADNLQQTGLVSSLGKWYAHPFNADGSALNWLLFVGLVIIVAFLWNLVIITVVPKTMEVIESAV